MQGSSLVLFIYSLFFCNFFWSKHSKVFNVCFLYAFWHDMVASLVAQTVKHLPAMQETWVQSLGQKDPLEKEMAPHSSTLAWKIPRTEEPGRLQSMGSQRVRHDWATSLHFTSYKSIITLNVNGLNAPTKRHRLAGWMKICVCMHFHLPHHST